MISVILILTGCRTFAIKNLSVSRYRRSHSLWPCNRFAG